jgi:hypothetical protein
MGKASQKKKLQRLTNENLKRYSGVKLSEALGELCQPFNDGSLNINSYRKLLSLGVTAWNIALKPQEERLDMLIQLIEKLPDYKTELASDFDKLMNTPQLPNQEPPDSLVILHMLNRLIKRKDELYPNDDRAIVDFNITEKPNSRYLTVKSIMPNLTK